MAKRYGKTPSGIVFPGGGLSSTEAQMFDLFVFSLAIERENREAEKAQRLAKRRKR
jgi:hypothetical protein